MLCTGILAAFTIGPIIIPDNEAEWTNEQVMIIIISGIKTYK